MTICVRDRFSTTRSFFVSPTFRADAFSAIVVSPSALVHRAFRRDPDAAGHHHQLALLIAVFGHTLPERQLAGALAFLFPGLARLGLGGQHVARTKRADVFVMLLRMKSAAGRRLALDPA